MNDLSDPASQGGTHSSPSIILFIASLVSYLTAFAASAVTVALPAIGREFELPASLQNWVITAFLIPSAVFLIPAGRAGDSFGRKRVFLAGLVLYFLAAVAAPFADRGLILIALRSVQGIGAALLAGTAGAIVVSVFPPEKRGRAIGINTAFVYAGLTTGPFLGGLLVGFVGWRSVFWLSAGAAALSFFAALIWMRGEWRGEAGAGFDRRGSALIAGAIGLLLGGLTDPRRLTGIAAIVGGFVILGFYYSYARRPHPLRPAPVLPLSLVTKNRAFVFSNLAALIHYGATFAVAFFLSLHLQNGRGMDPQSAGLVLLTQPLVQTVLSPITGRLSEKIAPRLLATVGLLLSGLSLFGLAAFAATSSIRGIVILLAALGTGYGLFSSPNMNAIMGSVERKDYGLANAMTGTMRLMGQTISMAIALFLTSAGGGIVEATAGAVLSDRAMETGFVVFGILCCLGVPASLARGKAAVR